MKKRAEQMVPAYDKLHTWDNYAAQLMVEYEQSWDEGKDIEPLKGLFEEVSRLPDGQEKAELANVLYRLAMNAPQRADYPYQEPSDLEEILPLCTQRPAKAPVNDAALQEKVRGAWYGRIAGCLLGKPIEGFYRSEMIHLLKSSGNWPIRGYIRQNTITLEVRAKFKFDVYNLAYADRTSNCAPADDDTNYTVLSGELIEQYGRDFTSANVAELWMSAQPKAAYCTAERVTFRNLVNGYLPPDSAQYKNPYREWIGAQIRGDYFGYINPGNPTAAAAMAWRDAVVSHTKNGIYGEMFAAAMVAWAAVCDDPAQVVQAGLDEIPITSRLHEGVSKAVAAWNAGETWEAQMEALYQHYDDENTHNWNHTISNAIIVAVALLYGQGSYGKSICLAVQSAFDTDCNGATVGSIVGMMGGYQIIESEWLEPICGMLDTDLFRVGAVSVEKMVERTMKHMTCA